MFSFFKFIQNTIKNLKQNKGLWFTILAVLSITGIFLSLYLLTHMTETASKDVYKSISKTYDKNFDNKFYIKELEFGKILLSVNSNENLITNIQENNLVEVGNIIDNYNNDFQGRGFESLELSFYPVVNQVNQYRNSVNSVITSKSKLFGLEVLLDGVYFVQLHPIVRDDEVLAIIEIKEKLEILRRLYINEDSLFVFLIEGRMLNRLSIEARNGNYREVVNDLFVQEKKYDNQFYTKIIENGEEAYSKMLKDGFYVDDQFYRTAKKISDVNGNVIGTVVLGQTVSNSGAFVNIVDNMTKTVTTVALGLVISILLFMF